MLSPFHPVLTGGPRSTGSRGRLQIVPSWHAWYTATTNAVGPIFCNVLFLPIGTMVKEEKSYDQ